MAVIPFTVGQLIKLAKIGSLTIVENHRQGGMIWQWEGMLPGAESESFDEIERALREKFPDGRIVEDIA